MLMRKFLSLSFYVKIIYLEINVIFYFYLRKTILCNLHINFYDIIVPRESSRRFFLQNISKLFCHARFNFNKIETNLENLI